MLQVRKGEEAQPPPPYDPVLGRIEAAMNYDQENLIVYGMEDTYDFIMDHHIRELMRLWYRSDDASRATFMSETSVAVPLRILLKSKPGYDYWVLIIEITKLYGTTS